MGNRLTSACSACVRSTCVGCPTDAPNASLLACVGHPHRKHHGEQRRAARFREVTSTANGNKARCHSVTESWQRGSLCCRPGRSASSRSDRRNGSRAACSSRNRHEGHGHCRKLGRLDRLPETRRSSPRRTNLRTTATHCHEGHNNPRIGGRSKNAILMGRTFHSECTVDRRSSRMEEIHVAPSSSCPSAIESRGQGDCES